MEIDRFLKYNNPFIQMADFRYLSKQIGTNHTLALNLWKTGTKEARILSTLIEIPDKVTDQQMETWVREFDTWYLSDFVCVNLFSKTTFAYNKAIQWSYQGLELIKRSGFILMATLAKNSKQAEDEMFYSFLTRILDEVEDSRNLVNRSISRSLYEIGKRNQNLKLKALETVFEIAKNQSESAQRIAESIYRKFKRDLIIV